MADLLVIMKSSQFRRQGLSELKYPANVDSTKIADGMRDTAENGLRHVRMAELAGRLHRLYRAQEVEKQPV
jgi:hypothetical protein